MHLNSVYITMQNNCEEPIIHILRVINANCFMMMSGRVRLIVIRRRFVNTLNSYKIVISGDDQGKPIFFGSLYILVAILSSITLD